MHRETIAVVVAVGLLVILMSLAASAQPVAARCGGVKSRGDWAKIRLPIRARAYAAHPKVTGRVFISDGRTLMATDNGGCTWREVFALPQLPSVDFPFAGEQITSIEVVPTTGRMVLAVTGPHVLLSDDDGRSWRTSDEGLISGGQPLILRSAPRTEDLYMAASTRLTDDALSGLIPTTGSAVQTTVVYRSEDGGEAWEIRGSPAISLFGPRDTQTSAETWPGNLWDLRVDPLDPDALWAASTAGAVRSDDGGLSWEVVRGLDVNIQTVAVNHKAGSPSSVIAVDPEVGVLYRSDDPEKLRWSEDFFTGFRTINVLYQNWAAAWGTHLLDADDIVVSTPKGVFRYFAPAASWVDITPLWVVERGIPLITQLTPDPMSDGAMYGMERNGSALYRYAPSTRGFRGVAGGFEQFLPEVDADIPFDFSDVSPKVTRKRADLEPGTLDLYLAPGESRTIEYKLKLPPRPTPLDVYFLLDTTGSMGETITSLTRALSKIAGEMRSAGIDIQAGVGAFRTYPSERDSSYVENYPYRRIRDIGPVDQELAEALLGLEGIGSSGSNLTALWQSASGEGQDVLPPGPSDGDIPPDRQANFRGDAVKVILHVADEWFGTPERGDPNGTYPGPSWPGPPFETAIQALENNGVEHAGLAVLGGPPNLLPVDADVVEDMDKVARGTGTLVPRGGLDCDGDGELDRQEREPLTCSIQRGEQSAGRVGSMVITLLKALKDPGTVELVERGDSGLITSIAPPRVQGVNLKDAHELSFQVTYTCGLEHVGKVLPVSLESRVQGATAAIAESTVACSPPATKDAHRPIALPPPPPVPPLVPPPLPVPGPAPAPAPAVQPATAPAGAQAGQGQAAAVPQRQEQPQMAFVHAARQLQQQMGMEHAMSAVGSGRDPLAMSRRGLGIGILTMLVVYGIATARVQHARMRVGRPRPVGPRRR